MRNLANFIHLVVAAAWKSPLRWGSPLQPAQGSTTWYKHVYYEMLATDRYKKGLDA